MFFSLSDREVTKKLLLSQLRGFLCRKYAINGNMAKESSAYFFRLPSCRVMGMTKSHLPDQTGVIHAARRLGSSYPTVVSFRAFISIYNTVKGLIKDNITTEIN